MSSKPHTWINGCLRAHRRLEPILSELTDDMARRPSLLPGWTVGHILTHLARNADANTAMVEGAQRGVVVTMYPGGTSQREADIIDGHARPASELVDDLSAAVHRLEAAWAATSDEVWATGLSRTFGGLRAIGFTVLMRWREAEVHMVDIGLTEVGGPSFQQLSPEYVETEWLEQTPGLGRRLPDGQAVLLVAGDRPSRVFGSGEEPVMIRAEPAAIVQWLMGRGGSPGWPPLTAWS